MELFEAMRTTFAARQFTNDPVPDEILYRILDHARFAPSGGNRQGWKVIVVRDQAKRDALGPLIAPVMKKYRAQVAAGENPFNTIEDSRVSTSDIDAVELPAGFTDQFTQAPIVLLILVDLRVVAAMDSNLERVGVIAGASIYPFVWNILLSARHEGYGGTLTTFLTASEPQVKELFDIPDHYAVCALLPIGKPVKQLTKLRRNPVSNFVVVDSFGGDSFMSS